MTIRDEIHKLIDEYEGMPYGEVHASLLLREYLKSHQRDWKAVVAFGDACRNLGRFTEASECLSKAFEQCTNDSIRGELALRAAMAFEASSPMAAEQWYDRSNAVHPFRYGWMWVLRGANLMKLERHDQAIDCYNTANRLPEVDKDELLMNLAWAHVAKGSFVEAIVYLNRANMVRPNRKTVELIESLSHATRTTELVKEMFKRPT